jgi:hypothetical protein
VRRALFCSAVAAEALLLFALHLVDDWALETMPLRFVLCAFAAGAAYFVAVTRATVDNALIFWSITILLRVVVLPAAPGDDLWRYQWEGRIQRAGYNPYVLAPGDPQLAVQRAGFPRWDKINHREFAAIYPPAAELIFRALSALSERPLLWKLIFAAADVGVAWLVLKLVRQEFAAAAWYAWNPLVVYSFAGAAHFDSLMLLPLAGGILLLVRHEAAAERGAQWRLALAAAACFGIAISFKLLPLLLLPMAAFALRRRAPALLLSLALGFGLGLIYRWPRVDIWHSLGNFAQVTRLNDIFWWLSEAFVWPNPRQKNGIYNRLLIGAVLVVSLVFWRNWRRGMLWAMGTALILSPVLHPWYCTWILPLAAWRQVRAWFVLSITLFAYFLFWNERLFALPWHAELWQRAIIIVPPLVALLFEWRNRSRVSPAPP